MDRLRKSLLAASAVMLLNIGAHAQESHSNFLRGWHTSLQEENKIPLVIGNAQNEQDKLDDRVRELSSSLGITLPDNILFITREYFAISKDLRFLQRLMNSYLSYEFLNTEGLSGKIYMSNVGQTNRMNDYMVSVSFRFDLNKEP